MRFGGDVRGKNVDTVVHIIPQTVSFLLLEQEFGFDSGGKGLKIQDILFGVKGKFRCDLCASGGGAGF